MRLVGIFDSGEGEDCSVMELWDPSEGWEPPADWHKVEGFSGFVPDITPEDAKAAAAVMGALIETPDGLL